MCHLTARMVVCEVTHLSHALNNLKSANYFLHIVSPCFVYIRYQIGDFSGEILNEVTVPLAEKTVYPAPTSLPMSSRHKAESKMKVKANSRREKRTYKST